MSGKPGSAEGSAAVRPGLLRRLYDRCMVKIQSPGGVWLMFGLAIAESSFFPIPPDLFLMALAITAPKKSFRYAAICTAGSVLGGMIGYGIGLLFMDAIGQQILVWYGLTDKYLAVQQLYQQYDAWAVGAAGFTPLPYKLFTITAGAFRIDFITFVLVSLLSRGGRFLLVAAFIYRFGAPIRTFIERYFNLLTVLFLILLALGYLVVRFLF